MTKHSRHNPIEHITFAPNVLPHPGRPRLLCAVAGTESFRGQPGAVWRLYDQLEIAELKQQVKAQAAAIQKVKDELELRTVLPQVVENR